jgi:Prealbumin-like fold domain
VELKVPRSRLATHPVLRRFAVLGVVLSLALLALVTTASSAFAHHAEFTGDAVCHPDGTWSINWSVTNSQGVPGRYMLVRAVSVSAGTLEGIEANETYEGVVDATHPNAAEGGGTVIPPDLTPVFFSTPDVPSSVDSVTLNMTSYWNYPEGDGFEIVTKYNDPFTVARPEGCVDSRPGHITVVKTTTGSTAPPGPFTFLVKLGDTTVGSIAVAANGSATSGDLEPGTYTLVEVDAPDGATITPNPVDVPANTTVTVTATNTYPTVEAAPPVVRTVAVAAPAPAIAAEGRFTG